MAERQLVGVRIVEFWVPEGCSVGRGAVEGRSAAKWLTESWFAEPWLVAGWLGMEWLVECRLVVG